MSTFPGDPAAFTMNFGATTAECVTKIGPSDAELDALDASVAAGRIKFNAADASSCNAGFSAVTCEALWGGTFEAPASCDTAIQGTVAIGGTCTTVGETDVGDCAGEANGCDAATMKCVAQ